MGRKLNLSEFTEEECDRILQVVVQDSILYQQEKQRLSQIKSDVEAEGSKYQVLSRSQAFNEKNCIRCFSRFWFIFNRKVNCSACRFHVCKKCYEIDPDIGKPICKACIKQRQYNRQSLDWFYSAVSKKFKHSGSTKVIRHLYRRKSTGKERLRRSSSDSQMNRIRHSSTKPPWCANTSGRNDGSEEELDSVSEDVRSLCERRSLPNILSQRLLDEMNNNSSNPGNKSTRSDVTEHADSCVQTELSLIRDDVISGACNDVTDPPHAVGGSGEWTESSCSSDLLRLAAGVTKSQGQVSTTATRMKHSADTLSSLYEEMDKMDERLDGLEDQMDNLNDDTDFLTQQLQSESQKIKSSAESVGLVTSAAMNVLCSAYRNHDSDSYTREVEEAEEENEESGASLKYFRRLNSSERIASSPIIGDSSSDTANIMNEHFLDRRGSSSSGCSDEYIVNRGSADISADIISADRSADSDVFSISEMYSASSSSQIDRKQEILRRQRSHSSRRSLNDLETTSTSDGISLKEAEQEIYMAAGNVFSLEEQVKLLEEKVLLMNEMTDEDLVSELENEVARTAARVNQSDKQVTEIEELVDDFDETTTV